VKNGGETQVTRAITLPVEWEGETKDLEFLIVPGLTQRFYFGINFRDTFGLTPNTPNILKLTNLTRNLKPWNAYIRAFIINFWRRSS